MTDSFEHLRQTVLTEVRKQRILAERSAPIRQTQLMGTFLKTRLDRMRRTPEDLAHLLGVTPEVVYLLLKGDLPDWMLNDEALDRLASALDYEPNLLRIMLQRRIEPTRDEGDTPAKAPAPKNASGNTARPRRDR